MCVFAICRIYIDCKSYMDNRLIPLRVLSCVVRQYHYEYDHVRRHLRLCPLMADETDAGMGSPCTGECEAYWRSFRLEPFLL